MTFYCCQRISSLSNVTFCIILKEKGKIVKKMFQIYTWKIFILYTQENKNAKRHFLLDLLHIILMPYCDTDIILLGMRNTNIRNVKNYDKLRLIGFPSTSNNSPWTALVQNPINKHN